MVPASREEFLRDACAGDESLQEEVESLLQYQDAAQDFMESPALDGEAGRLALGWADAASIDFVGRILGRYQIIEKIGAGGMGAVYRAHDTQLDRDLAIKVPLPGTHADEEHKVRLIREAKDASALNHPNIVTIYDIGSVEGVGSDDNHECVHRTAVRRRAIRSSLPDFAAQDEPCDLRQRYERINR